MFFAYLTNINVQAITFINNVYYNYPIKSSIKIPDIFFQHSYFLEYKLKIIQLGEYE